MRSGKFKSNSPYLILTEDSEPLASPKRNGEGRAIHSFDRTIGKTIREIAILRRAEFDTERVDRLRPSSNPDEIPSRTILPHFQPCRIVPTDWEVSIQPLSGRLNSNWPYTNNTKTSRPHPDRLPNNNGFEFQPGTHIPIPLPSAIETIQDSND